MVAGYQLGLLHVSVLRHHVGRCLHVLLRVQGVFHVVVLRGKVRHILLQIVEVAVRRVRLIFSAVSYLLLLLLRALLLRVAAELLTLNRLLKMWLLHLLFDLVVGLKRHVLLVVLLGNLVLLDLDV